MPVQQGRDQKGCFMRWGLRGKKYYYTCNSKIEKNAASDKASEQGRAIEANRNRE